MELKKYKLGEIADVIGGVAYAPADVCDKGIRILRGGNIQSQNIVFNNSDVFLPEKYRDSKNQILEGDTIIVASTGSVEVLGKAATCFTVMPNTQIGAFMRIVRPKQKKYAMLISIALNSPHFSKYIKSQAKGTSINNINIGHLNNYDILVSDKTDISYLSSIYENIESKIALCRATNKTLEAMAKQLYDYWFVQFDFPNENGKPYKTNGGKMVYNPQLKREVPEGWEVKELGEVLYENGTPITRNNVNNLPYTPIDKLPKKQMSFYESSPSDDAKSSLLQYEKYDILIGSMRVYFHRVLIAPYSGVTRTTTIVLKTKQDDYLSYLYEYLFTDEFIDYATKMSNGSQQPCLSWSAVKTKNIVLPNTKVNSLFQKILKPIIDSVILNHREISTLTTLRDSLLPLLMNGQVCVS